MAQKAIVRSLVGLTYNDGTSNWELTADCLITDGGSGTQANVTAMSSTFTPLLGWRPIMRSAIEEVATGLSLDIDAVLFPDLGVLVI